MRTTPRLLQIAKWLMTIATTLNISLLVASWLNTPHASSAQYINGPISKPRTVLQLAPGYLWVFREYPSPHADSFKEYFHRTYWSKPHGSVLWPVISGSESCTACSIPLAMTVVLLAIPTAYLWYRDRRRPKPGHCTNCSYILKGNQSGKCPECGTPIPKPDQTANVSEPRP